MQTIPLTQGQVTFIDDDDALLVSQYRWYAMRQKTLRGESRWYAITKIHGKVVGMHRLLYRTEPGFFPDHIDGNGLNNQKANLRPATKSQNAANSQKRQGKFSQYKGVSKSKRKHGRSWRAIISCNGTIYNLGAYQEETDAARAYDKKALELFGEYARLNFPS